jgi:hypothetical protein
MAPVAGGIADGEVNRDVAALRLIEGLWYPRPPMNGIVGVLAEVRAGRVG